MHDDTAEHMADPTGWTLRTDPAVDAYRVSGAWREETIWQLAVRLAEREPQRRTHQFAGRWHTAAEVVEDAARLSAALSARGFSAGDVIAFQLPNWYEALIIDLACARLGVVVVPIIPIYRDAELRFMLADCGARAIFVPGMALRGFDYLQMAAALAADLPQLEHVIPVRGEVSGSEAYETLLAQAQAQAAAAEINPGHAKMVLYTSGTTGKPKAVLHSHNTVSSVVREAYPRWGQGEGDTMLMASPVTHITGFSALELPFVMGMRSVFMTAWDPAEAVRLVDAEGATMSIGATPFLKELLDAAQAHGSRLPTLRTFACGGAEVPPELIHRAWDALENCRAFRVYGSSEAPLVTLGFCQPDQRRLAAESDGAIGSYELRICDDAGRELPDGEDGEICVRGAPLFLGYRDPQQTAESFDADGFFRTGDLGRRVAGDALVITGRKKDLINRGGEKISAKEVEDVLHSHPDVQEVAVVAAPHARLGECVCACVIARPGTSPSLADLVAQCATAGIARQKHPERVVLMEDFPRTASGKIRKDLLRKNPHVRQGEKERPLAM